MENLSVVEQSVWDDEYKQHEFSISDDPIMNDFIASHLSRRGETFRGWLLLGASFFR